MDNAPMDRHLKSENRITGMIGLARRAGKLTFGFDAVAQDIEARKAKAVLLSNDASPRTVIKIKGTCEHNRVELAVLPVSKAMLGWAIGRDDVAVVSIDDKSFADKILVLTSADVKCARDGQIDSGA